MTESALFERLWNGTAEMDEWTRAVSAGAITTITDRVIAIHSSYYCGAVTVIRTREGLVLIDTAGTAFAER
ncbi:MAG TPA: hypothetical protein PK264_18130, partial [Hyphomicrobiaceae bacterium]|nr:hypothetical protein [Hyphomicrobiaceae bacterium]